jgi:hypothetical protein
MKINTLIVNLINVESSDNKYNATLTAFKPKRSLVATTGSNALDCRLSTAKVPIWS